MREKWPQNDVEVAVPEARGVFPDSLEHQRALQESARVTAHGHTSRSWSKAHGHPRGKAAKTGATGGERGGSLDDDDNGCGRTPLNTPRMNNTQTHTHNTHTHTQHTITP